MQTLNIRVHTASESVLGGGGFGDRDIVDLLWVQAAECLLALAVRRC